MSIPLDSQLFLLAMGAFFLGAAGAGITGKWKRWYWTSKRQVYLYLPVGVLFLLVAAGEYFVEPRLSLALRAAEFLTLGVAVWWVIRPPHFIKPTWIRAIEAHPGPVYDAMAAAVKKGEVWRPLVETPEALDKWIHSVERQLPKRAKKK